MAKNFTVKSFRVFPLSLGLKYPFVTALGRKKASRNVGFEIRLEERVPGYGEASSSLALPDATAEKMSRTLKALGKGLIGQDLREWRKLIERAWAQYPGEPTALSAYECAVISAFTAGLGVPLDEWFGNSKKELETDITISAWPASLAARAAREAWKKGFRKLKIKVGTKGDLKRILAVREACPQAELALDGNQGLTVKSALKLVSSCLRENIAIGFLEQPLKKEDLKGHKILKRNLPVPLILDESVMSPQDALKVLELEAADGINVKLAKTGVLKSLEIVSLVQAFGKKLMIGCMAESARGLSFSVHLACGTGAFDWVDLDSDVLPAEKGAGAGFSRKGAVLILGGGDLRKEA